MVPAIGAPLPTDDVVSVRIVGKPFDGSGAIIDDERIRLQIAPHRRVAPHAMFWLASVIATGQKR